MGSTSRDYSKPTANVARRYFDKGDFARAKAEFRLIEEDDKTDIEVRVKLAICDYRLNGDMRALNDTKSANLPADLKQLILTHEVLGHVAARRFESAIKVLSDNTFTSDESRAIVELGDILAFLREGQAGATIRHHPHYKKVGITTPNAHRGTYLPEALDRLATVVDKNLYGENGKLIHITATYMMLMVEKQMPKSVRRPSNIAQLKRKLEGVDSKMKSSLPMTHNWVRTNFRF